MEKALLRLKHVAVGYGGTPLYKGVNTEVKAGELVSLLGSNGAGKSTLLRCVTGRLAPMSGEIDICGRALMGIPKRELAKLVSVVRTSQQMAGGLTVSELVALGRQPHTGFFGRLGAKDREIVGRSLESVGMGGFASRQVASLSDGERQKVMIARALAQETPVMVLDEPTAFLDVASRLETMQLLARLAADEKKAVLLSSHDVATAFRLSSRLWLLTQGENGERSLVDGSPSELVASGAVKELFRGRAVSFSPELLDFLPGESGV